MLSRIYRETEKNASARELVRRRSSQLKRIAGISRFDEFLSCRRRRRRRRPDARQSAPWPRRPVTGSRCAHEVKRRAVSNYPGISIICPSRARGDHDEIPRAMVVSSVERKFRSSALLPNCQKVYFEEFPGRNTRGNKIFPRYSWQASGF